MATELPRRDLIATIVREDSTRDRPYDMYRLWLYGEDCGLSGSLDGARESAEGHVGEPLYWEQVSPTRHEAWSHKER